jgi:hypothetical protein
MKTLNENITHLSIFNNRIDRMPTLPKSILTLDIRKTDIHECFDIPDSLDYIFNYGTPLCDKVQSYLKIHVPMFKPSILKTTFEAIRLIEHRFRTTYYCLKLKERLMVWLWRVRERIAVQTYHPDKLVEWLNHHDYDSLDHW